jgi:death on curing protein
MQERLGLDDLLRIAEGVLGEPAERLLGSVSIARAESALAGAFASFGEVEVYPDPVQRAAICCSRLVRNHPFPDGNAEIAYECMRELLGRGGFAWIRPREDAAEISHMIKALAVGTVSEEEFVSWVCARVP